MKMFIFLVVNLKILFNVEMFKNCVYLFNKGLDCVICTDFQELKKDQSKIWNIRSVTVLDPFVPPLPCKLKVVPSAKV